MAQAVRSRARLYAGLAATLVLAGMLWSGPRIHSAGFSTAVSPWTYLLNQAEMITRYLWLAVWPRALVVNYGWPRALTLADVWPQGIFILALLGATIVALRRSPPIGFLGAWFFMTLAPTSSIIPIATEVGAERRMYLPLIPLVVLAVVGGYLCWSLAERLRVRGPARETSRAGWLVFLGVSGSLGLGTVDRNREYGSAVRLAETALERFPTGVAHHTLAVELLAVGQSDEAMHHLRQAVPEAPRAYETLGRELFRQGKLDEAIDGLKRVRSGAAPAAGSSDCPRAPRQGAGGAESMAWKRSTRCRLVLKIIGRPSSGSICTA